MSDSPVIATSVFFDACDSSERVFNPRAAADAPVTNPIAASKPADFDFGCPQPQEREDDNRAAAMGPRDPDNAEATDDTAAGEEATDRCCFGGIGLGYGCFPRPLPHCCHPGAMMGWAGDFGYGYGYGCCGSVATAVCCVSPPPIVCTPPPVVVVEPPPVVCVPPPVVCTPPPVVCTPPPPVCSPPIYGPCYPQVGPCFVGPQPQAACWGGQQQQQQQQEAAMTTTTTTTTSTNSYNSNAAMMGGNASGCVGGMGMMGPWCGPMGYGGGAMMNGGYNGGNAYNASSTTSTTTTSSQQAACANNNGFAYNTAGGLGMGPMMMGGYGNCFRDLPVDGETTSEDRGAVLDAATAGAANNNAAQPYV